MQNLKLRVIGTRCPGNGRKGPTRRKDSRVHSEDPPSLTNVLSLHISSSGPSCCVQSGLRSDFLTEGRYIRRDGWMRVTEVIESPDMFAGTAKSVTTLHVQPSAPISAKLVAPSMCVGAYARNADLLRIVI